MAAAGESALEQKLKETETIAWYQGKCALREDIVHIDPDNPNDPDTFEGNVRACINRGSRVSFDAHMKPVLDCVKNEEDGNDDVRQDFFKRRLVLACYLAGSDDAAELFYEKKLKNQYLADMERLVKERVDSWINKGILKQATDDKEEWALREDLVVTLSGLIRHICPHEKEQGVNVREQEIAREVLELSESRRVSNLWDSLSSRSTRDSTFRQEAVAFYFQEDNPECMLTDNTVRVEAAHIAPVGAADRLPKYGLTEEDVNSPRNSLLLNRQIHLAFDKRQLTFLWDFIRDRFYCLVLDPKLRSARDFPKVHGKRLKLKRTKMPFRRLIVQHAFNALRRWETGGKNSHGLLTNNEGTHIDVGGQFLFRPEHYPGWPWLREDRTIASSTTEGDGNEGATPMDDIEFHDSWEYHQHQENGAAA